MRVEELSIVWEPWQPILIVAVYIVIILGIGLLARSKRLDRSEHDFYVTRWSTGWVGLSVSIAATFASAGYVMGTIGVFYDDPPALTGYLFGALLAPLVMWAVGRRLWPIARRDGYITYTDFIGDFYRSERLRVVVSLLVVVFFAPYFAVNLMAPGLLLETLTGGAIPYRAGVLLMAVIGTAYVLLGGMRGVIWTDLLQAAVMYVMFLVLVPITIAAAGGLSAIVVALPAESYGYDFSLETWMLVVSWMVLICLMQPANPDRAFRLLAARSVSAIRHGAIAATVLLGLWSVIGLGLGWSLNLLIPGVEDPDLVMPVAVTEYAPLLMPLFLAALWAGGMSTLDSGMIACAAMLTRDVYRRNVNPEATQRQAMLRSRILILSFGVFAAFVALADPPFLWYFIAAAAAVAMQWLPAVLFALYWKRANTQAAWAGILSGIAVTVLFQYGLETPWPGPGGPAIMGLLVQIPLYIAVALATAPLPAAHRERYQGPFDRPPDRALQR